jgi:hypothetical protein
MVLAVLAILGVARRDQPRTAGEPGAARELAACSSAAHDN